MNKRLQDTMKFFCSLFALLLSGCAAVSTAPINKAAKPAGAAKHAGLKGKIAFASRRNGNTEIYVMNADGSHQTRLTFRKGVEQNPCLSADGKKISFWSPTQQQRPNLSHEFTEQDSNKAH